MKKLNLSQCRLRMWELIRQERKLAQVIMGKDVLVKGSVFRMRVKCGKKQCKCYRHGQLHTAWCLTRSHKGRPQVRYLKIKEVLDYKRLTGSYRRFRTARAELVKLHKQMLALIDTIERLKRKETFK